MLKNRLGLGFRSNGRRRTVTVKFDHLTLEGWQYDQSVTGPADEHPVTQLRRLAPQVLTRIERALVAVHGEPEVGP